MPHTLGPQGVLVLPGRTSGLPFIWAGLIFWKKGFQKSQEELQGVNVTGKRLRPLNDDLSISISARWEDSRMRKAWRLSLTLQYPYTVFKRSKDQQQGRQEGNYFSQYLPSAKIWVSGTTPLSNLVPTVTLFRLRQSLPMSSQLRQSCLSLLSRELQACTTTLGNLQLFFKSGNRTPLYEVSYQRDQKIKQLA